ncbi:hypothetical protein ACOME3_001278 [Neoechinorhynchus agilis]
MSLNHFLYNNNDGTWISGIRGRFSHNYHNTISQGSARFPFSTLCEFTVRGMGDKRQSYLVHCSIPINIFNAKIFGFLYFWTLICMAMSIIGLVRISFHMVFRSHRKRFIQKILFERGCPSFMLDIKGAKHYLDAKIDSRNPEQLNTVVEDIDAFIDRYLGADGVLVLKKMSTDVRIKAIDHLWSRFVARRQFQMPKI